mgnify:CR=1 FL=1
MYIMYAIEDLFLGIQGHPEAEKTFAAALYNSRIEMIGQESVQRAINSLEKTVHHATWAKWIYNFLSLPENRTWESTNSPCGRGFLSP